MESLSPASPRSWLQEEFARRKRMNANYSLRAFSRDLGLPSGRLSELLSGKRGFTPTIIQRVVSRLELGPDLAESWIRENDAKQKGSGRKRPSVSAHARYLQLSQDQFNVIADWYHFAILALLETEKKSPSNARIAARLQITEQEASQALQRLERLGLIKRTAKRIVPTHTNLSTTHEISSVALRSSHIQSLQQVISRLNETPLEIRDVTSITMAINMQKLPEAKELIREFRRKMSSLLEKGQKTEVYNLNIQLMPVSQVQKPGVSKKGKTAYEH